MRKITSSKLAFIARFAVLITFVDRILFNSALYADGACHLFSSLFLGDVFISQANRSVASILLAVPLRLLELIGVKDFNYLYFAWKLGFCVPFAIAFAVNFLLRSRYRPIGFFFLSVTTLVFYLPNSLMAVAEYNILFPLVSVLLPSLHQFRYESDGRSATIVFLTLVLMCFAYEGGAVMAIAVSGIMVLEHIAQRFISARLSVRVFFDVIFSQETIIRAVLFGIVFGSALIAIVATPDWAKANALRSLTSFTTDLRYGAIGDTWLYFIIFFCILMLGSCLVTAKRSENTWRPGVFLAVWFVSVFAVFANHLPNHGFFSKGVYMILLACLTISYCCLGLPRIFNSIRATALVLVALLPVCAGFVIWEGIQFNRYLRGFKKILIALPENSSASTDNISYFIKPGADVFKWSLAQYSWSWGHICISVYLSPPNRALIIGPYDQEFFSFYDRLITDRRVPAPGE